MRALVGPFSSTPAAPPKRCGGGSSSPSGPYWHWTSRISARREASRAFEIALRASGRLSSRMRMWPLDGWPAGAVGRLVTRTRGSAVVE
ncbi:hypothetical protein MKX07_007102 [Trichoderma sp. CBMAI-0711]|nr:hypothetical protein MKX07_007102 [Trichoderma sp. CBMAI-0711]